MERKMKNMKKHIAVLLTLIIIACSWNPAWAGQLSSSSQSYAEGTTITFGKNYAGTITSSSEPDCYILNLTSAGCVQLDFNNGMNKAVIYIKDTSDSIVWGQKYTTGVKEQYDIYLTAGTYYLYIGGYYCTGTYSFTAQFASANETFPEYNNTMQTASDIALGQKIYGQIASNDYVDIFKFTLTEAGRVEMDFNNGMTSVRVYIKDVSDTVVWGSEYIYGVAEQYDIDLKAGTYYFFVERHNNNENTGNYNFDTKFVSANESFSEDNNTLHTASEASLGQNIYGQIASNDNVDMYKYTLTNDQTLQLIFNNEMEKVKIYINDTSNSTKWGAKYIYGVNESYEITLSAGTYYFCVERYDGKTGNYNFTFGDPSSYVETPKPTNTPTPTKTPTPQSTPTPNPQGTTAPKETSAPTPLSEGFSIEAEEISEDTYRVTVYLAADRCAALEIHLKCEGISVISYDLTEEVKNLAHMELPNLYSEDGYECVSFAAIDLEGSTMSCAVAETTVHLDDVAGTIQMEAALTVYEENYETVELPRTERTIMLGDPVIYGDVDENGKVEASDALATLRYVVQLTTLTEKQQTAANVDGDGKITASDALLILKKVVKLIDQFPVE